MLFTILNFTQGNLHSTGGIQISFQWGYNSTGGIQLSFLGVYNSTGGIQKSFLGYYNSTGGIIFCYKFFLVSNSSCLANFLREKRFNIFNHYSIKENQRIEKIFVNYFIRSPFANLQQQLHLQHSSQISLQKMEAITTLKL